MPSRIGLHRLSGFGKQPFLERQARLEAAEPAKFLAGFLPRVEVEKAAPAELALFFHRNHAELECEPFQRTLDGVRNSPQLNDPDLAQDGDPSAVLRTESHGAVRSAVNERSADRSLRLGKPEVGGPIATCGQHHRVIRTPFGGCNPSWVAQR